MDNQKLSTTSFHGYYELRKIFLFLLLVLFSNINTFGQGIQKKKYSHTILSSTYFGNRNIGNKLQYQGALNRYISFNMGVGFQFRKTKIDRYREGEIAIKSKGVGFGLTINLTGKPKGFFLQSNVDFAQIETSASAYVRDPSSFRPNSDVLILNLIGLFFSSPYTLVEHKSKRKVAKLNGKIGYRFVSKSGIISFSPYLGFEPSLVENKEHTMGNVNAQRISFNSKQEFGKQGVIMGIDFGVSF